MADSTLSTLEQIRTRVRRLTKSPSAAQLSNGDIDSYINTFVLYDMPSYLRLNTLKELLTFYTDPNVGTYSTITADAEDPMYNFKNKYVSATDLAYVGGNRISFSQSRSEFYNAYPLNNYKESIGTGDGIETNFTGTLTNIPVLPNNVTLSSVDGGGDPQKANDDGISTFSGDVTAASSIAYIAGTYDITFDLAPGAGEDIWIQTVPYKASKPVSILYINEEFVLRPVPDITYRVDVEMYRRPTEFLSADTTQQPELAQWSQYISYGAAVKLLQERMDQESVAILMPEFKNQERLVNRHKINQNSIKRVATIYTNGIVSSSSTEKD